MAMHFTFCHPSKVVAPLSSQLFGLTSEPFWGPWHLAGAGGRGGSGAPRGSPCKRGFKWHMVQLGKDEEERPQPGRRGGRQETPVDPPPSWAHSANIWARAVVWNVPQDSCGGLGLWPLPRLPRLPSTG